MKLSLQNKTNAVSRKKRFFVPTDIGTSCVGWWDFTDGRYIYSGDGTVAIAKDVGIRRIKNKANELGKTTTPLGLYLDSTSTSAKQPTWKEGGFNRRYYADFDGVENVILANQSIGNVSTDVLATTSLDHDAFTMFAVFAPDDATISGTSSASDQTIFAIANSASSKIDLRIDNASTEYITVLNANGISRNTTDISSGVSNTAATQWWTYISNGDHNTITGDLYKNGDRDVGVGNGTGTDGDMLLSTDSSANLITIGAGTATANEFDGKIYEIIVFDALLNSSEISLMETYIKSKYGKMP
jgi:hypothetical protein